MDTKTKRGGDALSKYLLCIPGTDNLGGGNTRNLKCTAFFRPIDLLTIRADKLQIKNGSAGYWL